LQSATGLAARLASTCQSKGTNQGKYAREPSGQSGVYRECESNLSTYPPDLPTQFCTVAPVRKKIDQDFSTPPAAVISRVGRGSRGQEDGVAAGTAAVHRALAKYARRTLIVHLSDLSDSEPSGSRMRYMFGHVASGTMRGVQPPNNISDKLRFFVRGSPGS
jgi:hypothetical protein